MYDCRVALFDRQFVLHILSSKNGLQKFLLPPLYYMFPLGIKFLDGGEYAETRRSNLNQWVDVHREEFNIQPLELNK